jgi:hypothetical protein
VSMIALADADWLFCIRYAGFSPVSITRNGLSGSRAVDMEHRAVAICPGLNEVEHEGRGESREQRESVS